MKVLRLCIMTYLLPSGKQCTHFPSLTKLKQYSSPRWYTPSPAQKEKIAPVYEMTEIRFHWDCTAKLRVVNAHYNDLFCECDNFCVQKNPHCAFQMTACVLLWQAIVSDTKRPRIELQWNLRIEDTLGPTILFFCREAGLASLWRCQLEGTIWLGARRPLQRALYVVPRLLGHTS